MTDLSTTNVLAEAEQALVEGNYRVVRNPPLPALGEEHALLAEDPYGIVAVVTYETLGELVDRWPLAQGALVDAMSGSLPAGDPKGWEGYLVLFTTALPSSETVFELDAIRYDTSRVRKLVAAGDRLQTLADVRQALSPLLPLEPEKLELAAGYELDALPRLLSDEVDPSVVERAVEAFRQRKPIVETLHRFLHE